MACSNNMGHLAYHLSDDFGRSSRTMSNLQYLLTWLFANVNESHNENDAASALSFILLDDLDIKGFEWNVRFMYPPNNAPAA